MLGTPAGLREWTYGAEHEWADWNTRQPLPPWYGRDMRDKTIVNSNGIANDPSGKLYPYGGEINTPPTNTPNGQVECMRELRGMLPEATVNYRSNLHIHIRVPGLGEDLVLLKRAQLYIHENMPKVLAHIEPLPRPVQEDHSSEEIFRGALKRWRRCRVSHQTLLTPKRVEGQLRAGTVHEFYRREVPQSRDGKPMWHCQPRLCVNLRQHRETDTIEFRHFSGTMDEAELETALYWCQWFMIWAFRGGAIEDLLGKDRFSPDKFPKAQPYRHDLEMSYQRTMHGGLPKAERIENIMKILAGGVDDL